MERDPVIKQMKSGFSLMELMIYIAIVGLLVAVGVPAYVGYQQRARHSTTEQNLRLLKSSINLYQMEQNKYPARLEDLAERPKGDEGKKWHQYIERVPQDGWGSEFYYKVTPGGKHPYELYSYGGSSDDDIEKRIDVWKI